MVVQILAALELGRRIHSLACKDRYVIRFPEDAANFLMGDMRFLSQEHFVCLYLNTNFNGRSLMINPPF